MSHPIPDDLQDAVAVIGMAGRFPGAPNVRAFWRNIVEGLDTISRFAPDELDPAGGEDMRERADANYVPARGIVDDAEMFDAAFFQVTPNEAAVMDPQQRVFLETAWEAFEDAGYDPARFEGPIGVFAGASNNTYFRNNLIHRPDVTDAVGALTAMMGNEKDYLATRTAYRLDLKGPALNIVTACSTSLVALSTAVLSLATYQSDMALAGGVSIMLPQRRGYLWQEGGITSPDGYCRAFDADAGGTVFSNGLGIVVLRRLENALADGDTIYAVIRSAALNNDGSAKVSFTAPSVQGHAEVISMAHALAGVDPATISYIEAHGTGTALGDPIEIAGLTEAFRAGGVTGTRTCALGSVKTNIGHLDAAAGIAGLIKTVQALHHATLPATLNFKAPNPKLELDRSPFFINDRCRPWPRGETPRRAGVSSFGVGGTNAHVVLEEAPEATPPEPARPAHLVVLSARTPDALREQRRQLRAHLADHPDLDLADTAYTLQTGRRAFDERWAATVTNRKEVLDALATEPAPAAPRATTAKREAPHVAFLLPGQGAQGIRMAAALYENEPLFAREIDEASEILRPLIDADLRQLLYPEPGRETEAAARLDETAVTQPALFAVEYALARLMMSWGVRPDSLLGHSLGEYVAATLAGTFERDAALELVARRAALMQAQPAGAMLAVRASAVQLLNLLGEDVSIAAYNAPNSVVVAGSTPAIDHLAETLEAAGIACSKLRTSHAFHSAMMDPVMPPLEELVRAARPKPPEMSWYSCLTGNPISETEATDPTYWSRQMRHAVRFSDAMAGLVATPNAQLFEIGPGRSLAGFARQHGTREASRPVITTLGEPALPNAAGLGQTIAAVGELWTAGVAIDWRAFNDGRRRRRISLPTYPFERTRHWVEPTQATTSTTQPAPPKAEPMEAKAPPQAPGPDHAAVRTSVRTLFTDLSGFAPEHFDDDKPLIELGLDSLVLTQAIGALRKRFAITLKLPQLMGDLETITAIAAHLARHAPPERLPMTSAPPLPATTALAPAPTTSAAPTPSPTASGDATALVAQNLQLMARQLDLLQHALLGSASARPDVAATVTPCPVPETATQPAPPPHAP